MSRHCVQHKDYYICYGWDSVPPMRTFFMQVKPADENHPKETIYQMSITTSGRDNYLGNERFLESA